MSTLPDPRSHLDRALSLASRTVHAVAADHLGLPTPCSEYDVRQLLGHMVFATARAAEAGRHEPVILEGDFHARGLVDDSWGAAFDEQAAAARSAWQGPHALEGEIELPFGTFPAAVVGWIYTMELATHSWDLAMAIDRAGLLEDDLYDAILPFARQMLPAEGREAPDLPFAPVVAVPESAPASDRLAGHLGRLPVGGHQPLPG